MITQRQLILLLVGVLALLFVATLYWSNQERGGLFGTTVNTSGVVVESSECGARRNDVCLILDLNHEVVLADTNGIEVAVGYRVQALINDDLSRATITNVIETGSANPGSQIVVENPLGSPQDSAESADQEAVPLRIEMPYKILLPLIING